MATILRHVPAGEKVGIAFSNDGSLGLLGGADGTLTVVRFLPD